MPQPSEPNIPFGSPFYERNRYEASRSRALTQGMGAATMALCTLILLPMEAGGSLIGLLIAGGCAYLCWKMGMESYQRRQEMNQIQNRARRPWND